MKLNLFEILLYGILLKLKFPDLQYIHKIDIMQENMLHAYSGLPVWIPIHFHQYPSTYMTISEMMTYLYNHQALKKVYNDKTQFYEWVYYMLLHHV